MKFYYFSLIFLISIIVSCSQNKQIQQIENDFATTNSEINNSEIDSLLYNIPDYNNIFSILNDCLSDFNDTFLLPCQKADFYDNTKQTSLLLGMYLADLAYLRHFEKVQLCSDFLDAVKILSNKLAITNENIDNLVPQIEDNLDDKGFLFAVIDSLLNKGNKIFSNNEVYSINILCITGFWLESTEIAYSNNVFTKINDSISNEHQNTLFAIINILEKINDDNYINDICENLKKIYQNKEIKHSEILTLREKIITI